ncbi:MAG: TetR/AcrR family transcriptional regulator [Acholeplasmataceae bacterium]|nr:TetR/AcrR family transcriptional regulator [Acholeplasmataceae bacterium]
MRNQEIKRRIVEETKKLIKMHAGVTIKDISEACYVNIAAVNYHFGSKEKLLLEVITEVLDELKFYLSDKMTEVTKTNSLASILEDIIAYTYNFALENTGILSYLFLTKDIQTESSNLLIKTFFTDNDFTKMVLKSLKQTIHSDNEKQVFARYMILFSSFSIPLFIQISQMKSSNDLKIETFKDSEFRQYFIKDLMKMIERV